MVFSFNYCTDYNKIRKIYWDHLLAHGHEITFNHNSTCKTHLEKVCRDTLRSGHTMEVCCFKSHKLKVIFGHLLFNVLHSRGQMRCGWNLSAIPHVICKIENGPKSLDHDELKSKRKLQSSDLVTMIVNKSIIYSCYWLRLEILPFLPCLYHIPKNMVSQQP